MGLNSSWVYSVSLATITCSRSSDNDCMHMFAYSGGANISPEGKTLGLTHTFVMEFSSEADRDAYLIHPAHVAFGDEFGKFVENVFVSGESQCASLRT